MELHRILANEIISIFNYRIYKKNGNANAYYYPSHQEIEHTGPYAIVMYDDTTSYIRCILYLSYLEMELVKHDRSHIKNAEVISTEYADPHLFEIVKKAANNYNKNYKV
jgi:hypothetical protein